MYFKAVSSEPFAHKGACCHQQKKKIINFLNQKKNQVQIPQTNQIPLSPGTIHGQMPGVRC